LDRRAAAPGGGPPRRAVRHPPSRARSPRRPPWTRGRGDAKTRRGLPFPPTAPLSLWALRGRFLGWAPHRAAAAASRRGTYPCELPLGETRVTAPEMAAGPGSPRPRVPASPRPPVPDPLALALLRWQRAAGPY